MPSVHARPRPALRLFSALLVSGALALGVTACGSDSDESASTAGTTSTAASGATAAAFPVTIKHAQGSTTIKSEPKRIVALGWSDQDPLLALGIKPVAYTEWFNEEPGGIFPWAEKAAAGAKPEKVATADQIDYEKLAAVQPDLILALYDEIDGPTYKKLSKIAPVVANDPKYDGFGATWQDLTITTGKAVGREPQARKLVSDLEGRFAKLRTEHPEWSKETLVMMADLVNGNFSVFSPQDAKTRFFANLGFQTTPKFLDGKFPKGENTTIVSAEDAKLLDVDRLAWTSDPVLVGKLKKNRLYNTLNVVKDGRVSYLDYTKAPFTGAAVTFNTVLSIPYALDRVIPQLAAAKQSR
jgi:iron complex transport system substrate-binding protein